MNIANEWEDYKIIDMANGEKLEKWGNITLVRPDPQIIWKDKSFPEKWNQANARYNRSNTGGGAWEYKKRLPESWQIKYKDLTFNIKPMGFKHTGLFPEQAVNWDWMMDKIKNEKVEQIFMANHLFEIGKSQVNYNNVQINIYNKERMLIELIRNKNTFAFDYYKEIISNYREIADEIDMSLLADYLEYVANGKNIFKIIHREVF